MDNLLCEERYYMMRQRHRLGVSKAFGEYRTDCIVALSGTLDEADRRDLCTETSI